jgi:nicotinic acid mononucleotide adenylyltransferase
MEERLPGISERIYWIKGEEQAISGWDVRCRVRAGLPIAGLVPEKVADVIVTHGLYTGNTSEK